MKRLTITRNKKLTFEEQRREMALEIFGMENLDFDPPGEIKKIILDLLENIQARDLIFRELKVSDQKKEEYFNRAIRFMFEKDLEVLTGRAK